MAKMKSSLQISGPSESLGMLLVSLTELPARHRLTSCGCTDSGRTRGSLKRTVSRTCYQRIVIPSAKPSTHSCVRCTVGSVLILTKLPRSDGRHGRKRKRSVESSSEAQPVVRNVSRYLMNYTVSCRGKDR